ncbi:rad, Gem/Kir family member 3 [Lycorma delicatula]|uniref:rad, Gem/Kir family member 3 n=1 Tax=Lycorma delicatula TaxID=130591 RepID=UPI003F510649
MTMEEANLAARQGKGRSASICAPSFSSMEAMVPGTPPPEGGRRRRPAARSQSARLTGNKSIRRRAVAANQQEMGSNHSMRSGSSEPRLSETTGPDSPSPGGFRRKGSARRVNSVYQRKSTAFLDVPDSPTASLQPEDEDSYRLRSFSFTSKGVVNRGDSFRRRRSRSNSLLPPQGQAGQDCGPTAPEPPPPLSPLHSPDFTSYTVAMVGAQGVGKTALVSQFMTSECINAYDRQRDMPTEQSVCIMLNGEESELKFINVENRGELDTNIVADAYVIMYSVIDKASFQRAEVELNRLQDNEMLRSRPAILVANKVDLVRSRAVSSQDGKCLACTYRAKFIEISVGINHNVDELLVGILNQIRLKREQGDKDTSSHWYKNRGMVRASMKARQMFTWIFGKEDSKFKNCENLHVL